LVLKSVVLIRNLLNLFPLSFFFSSTNAPENASQTNQRTRSLFQIHLANTTVQPFHLPTQNHQCFVLLLGGILERCEAAWWSACVFLCWRGVRFLCWCGSAVGVLVALCAALTSSSFLLCTPVALLMRKSICVSRAGEFRWVLAWVLG
jgi:hypothetical protein